MCEIPSHECYHKFRVYIVASFESQTWWCACYKVLCTEEEESTSPRVLPFSPVFFFFHVGFGWVSCNVINIMRIIVYQKSKQSTFYKDDLILPLILMPSFLDSPNIVCVELCGFKDFFTLWPRVVTMKF